MEVNEVDASVVYAE